MRILQIASLVEPLADSAPGGAEVCATLLSEELAALGHDVSILAVTGSKAPTGVKLIDLGISRGDVFPIDTAIDLAADAAAEVSPLGEPSLNSLGDLAAANTMLPAFGRIADHLRTNSEPYSIVHNHGFDFDPLFVLPRQFPHIPFFHTLHLPPISPAIVTGLQALEQNFVAQSFCTVSQAMSATYRERTQRNLPVVLNGISLPKNSPNCSEDRSRSPFLFVGRISPEKGLHTAIDLIVDELKQPLTIIGRVYDQNYFDSRIAPRLHNELIDFRGFLPREQVFQAMSSARALVAPIEWEEPFGYVFLEALANGCPVVVFNRGAAAEIIEHEQTGFIATNRREFLDYLTRVSVISRHQCRDSIIERFSVRATCARYLEFYRNLTSIE